MAISVFGRTETSFSGRRKPTVNYGHALSRGLVAAFVGNPGGGGSGMSNTFGDPTVEIVSNQPYLFDQLAGTPTKRRMSPAGPGLESPARTSGAMPPVMRPPSVVSLLWYGIITANISGSGAGYLAGTAYDTLNSTPFDCYSICRPSGDSTGVYIGYNDAATTFQGFTVTSQIASTDYNCNPIVFSASFGAGTVHAYKNGRQIGSAARVGSTIAYSVSPVTLPSGFSINGTYRATTSTADPHSVTNIAIVWNRELTATEHMLLALNPWQIFTSTRVASWPVPSVPPPSTFNALLV